MKTKWCLVTGAGTRVGAAIAQHMLVKGYSVIAHYNRSKDGIEQLLGIAKKGGCAVRPIHGDFSTKNGIEAFRKELNSLVGDVQINVVIHSAAVMRAGKIESVAMDEIEMIMNINALAPLMITQGLWKKMVDGGSVIMISDIAADQTWRDYPIYAMSKNQLELVARHFAKVFAPMVRVNTIQLGLVIRSVGETEEGWNTRVDRVPLQRTVTLEELNATIDLLISNRSMTGTKIVLDSGASLE